MSQIPFLPDLYLVGYTAKYRMQKNARDKYRMQKNARDFGDKLDRAPTAPPRPAPAKEAVTESRIGKADKESEENEESEEFVRNPMAHGLAPGFAIGAGAHFLPQGLYGEDAFRTGTSMLAGGAVGGTVGALQGNKMGARKRLLHILLGIIGGAGGAGVADRSVLAVKELQKQAGPLEWLNSKLSPTPNPSAASTTKAIAAAGHTAPSTPAMVRSAQKTQNAAKAKQWVSDRGGGAPLARSWFIDGTINPINSLQGASNEITNDLIRKVLRLPGASSKTRSINWDTPGTYWREGKELRPLPAGGGIFTGQTSYGPDSVVGP
jgi:hypothetical protein